MAAFLMSALVVLASQTIRAQRPKSAPNNVNVQGKLTTQGGGPVSTGNHTLSSRIFPVSVGGSQFWPAGGDEDHLTAIGSDGPWTATLRKDGELTVGNMDDTTRRLEITLTPPVGSPETLSGIKLSSNPFTLEAGQLNGRTGDEHVENAGDQMTGAQRFDFNGDSNLNAELRQDAETTSILGMRRGLYRRDVDATDEHCFKRQRSVSPRLRGAWRIVRANIATRCSSAMLDSCWEPQYGGTRVELY